MDSKISQCSIVNAKDPNAPPKLMTFELNHEDCSNDAEFVLTKVSINICPSSSEGNFF